MNAFNWRTGAPSIFHTVAAESAAKRLAGASFNGCGMDSKGRPLVDMKPRSTNAIAITSRADDLRNQMIKRGTST